MGNRIDTKIVLGSKRYKTAIDTDLLIEVPLVNTQKEMDEFDRSNVVSLAQIFDDERQASSTFRLTAKIDLIFYNAYSGSLVAPIYVPFLNNICYINSELSFNTNSWSGYPQYSEFDFIRTDNNVSGYTVNSGSTTPHVSFINLSATTYNWTQYISYAFDNDYTKDLQFNINGVFDVLNWKSGDGLPFYKTLHTTYNGQNLISFTCPVEHGLNSGEWVEFNIAGWAGYNGTKVFQVYSLGNYGYNSDKYVFNIYDNGFTGTTFSNNTKGTFKRIIDISNSGETMSKYYVRRHKIITNVGDAILNNAGYDKNGFGVTRQYEYSSLTPDHTARVCQREGNQSYVLTFGKDIDINLYRDNLNRPLSELFVTIINKGYFGWMNQPLSPTSKTGVREGYGYNITTIPSDYWDITNIINASNVEYDSYTIGGLTFYYNKDFKSGDTLNGPYCEFNQFEQKERIISEYYHKLWYNDLLFLIGDAPSTNPDGYYYKPHNLITLKVYSDYIEEGLVKDIAGVPDYAYYSDYYEKLFWRDLYTYGFIDESGFGVDYPFLNGAHYPSTKIIFRLFPEGNVAENIGTIADPITDDCE